MFKLLELEHCRKHVTNALGPDLIFIYMNDNLPEKNVMNVIFKNKTSFH